jgi:hypothetical protein
MVDQIIKGTAKGAGAYILEVQSKYDSQIANGKRIKNIQPEEAEQVQWVRL